MPRRFPPAARASGVPSPGRTITPPGRRSEPRKTLVAIKGTNSYGSGLARFLRSTDPGLCEVRPPRRASRAGHGKSVRLRRLGGSTHGARGTGRGPAPAVALIAGKAAGGNNSIDLRGIHFEGTYRLCAACLVYAGLLGVERVSTRSPAHGELLHPGGRKPPTVSRARPAPHAVRPTASDIRACTSHPPVTCR